MTPKERDRVVRLARRRQAEGDLLAWSIDEPSNRVTFFVAEDAAERGRVPDNVGTVGIVLHPLPRAQELLVRRTP